MNRSKLVNVLMCCCVMTMAGGAMAQDKAPAAPKVTPAKEMPKNIQPADKKDGHAMPGVDSAEMEAMMKAGMPGPMHEWLNKFAGAWDANVKMWMAPGAPVMESKGTMTGSVMFGKYVHSMYKGEMMGQPFEGALLMGYDNVTEKFQSTWVDSMSTGTMTSTGTLSADKKTLTMTGECVDPMTKKPSATREVTTWVSDDKFTSEMYCTKDGKEFKCMEIAYTKSKGASKEKDAMDKMKDDASKKAKEAEDKMRKSVPAK